MAEFLCFGFKIASIGIGYAMVDSLAANNINPQSAQCV
jgi:hypothetical protein